MSVRRDVRWVNVTDHLAGVIGTTNDALPGLNRAVNALPPTGGVLAFEPGHTYRLSDTWVVRRSNTQIYLPPGATLETVTPTTLGGVMVIGEGTAFGGSDTAELENVGMWGGGLVRSTGSAGLDNAISFVRCRNWFVDGMIADADRYGITGQVRMTGGRITRNRVLRAETAGINVQTNQADAAAGEPVDDHVIAFNRIERSVNAGNTGAGKGIELGYFDRASLIGNTVENCDDRAIHAFGSAAAGVTSAELFGEGNQIRNSRVGAWLEGIDNLRGRDLAAIRGCEFGAVIQDSAYVDIGIDVRDVATGNSVTANNVTDMLRLHAIIANQTSPSPALGIGNPPALNMIDVMVGPGSHSHVLADAGTFHLQGDVTPGGTATFGGTTNVHPGMGLTVAGVPF